MSLMNARAFCPMRLPTTSAERKHLTRFRRRRSDSGTSVDVNVVGWQFEIFPNPLAGVEALKPNVSCVGRARSSYPYHTESVSLVVAAPQADHISDDEPCRDVSEHGPLRLTFTVFEASMKGRPLASIPHKRMGNMAA